ncbi:MAG: DUF3822 family protein [Flaviramulus sp.]|nr:DUF3822 family protein [Flaviramulus sp.]
MALQNKNSSKPINLELSIQISLSGLSFCILNRDSNTITYLKEKPFEKNLNPIEALDVLKEHFNDVIVFNNEFSKVTIIHDNDLSALVPKPLFNEDCLADYLKFNSKILKSDFITFDNILINDSVNVYVPYVNFNNFIYEKFGSFTYKHISTILIEEILSVEKNNEDSRIYVNVSSNHFETMAVKNSKLVLYNSFNYSSKEDFIYFILFTAEQLNLNPESLDLVLIGEISKNDELYNIAYKYIRNIRFGNRNDSYKFDQKPNSEYSNFTLIKSF